MKIKMSRKKWESIGKQAGWYTSSDKYDITLYKCIKCTIKIDGGEDEEISPEGADVQPYYLIGTLERDFDTITQQDKYTKATSNITNDIVTCMFKKVNVVAHIGYQKGEESSLYSPGEPGGTYIEKIVDEDSEEDITEKLSESLLEEIRLAINEKYDLPEDFFPGPGPSLAHPS